MGRISSFMPGGLKKRLTDLSGRSVHRADPQTPPEPDSAGALAEEEAGLPTPPSAFPRLPARNAGAAPRELVKPYLEYETSPRKDFAAGTERIGRHANLVPVYSRHENLFKIRAADLPTGDDGRYLMPLHEDEWESHGSPAIAPSLDEYGKNF
ncbi:hypothetical protein VUR80DRAFT_7452 [Thermomyces stellatus]